LDVDLRDNACHSFANYSIRNASSKIGRSSRLRQAPGRLRWLAQNVASGKANVGPPKKVVGRRGGRQEVVEAPAEIVARPR
jgi:hypothetical protein